MCGIFFAKSLKKIDSNQIYNSLDKRGPDMTGYFNIKDLNFFHKRLSILDLSQHGIQPMFDDKKENIILFNGEIYNFKELRKKIKKTYFSNTDTEVVLELYKKYGVKMLNMIKGMFVFIIYNFRSETLFIARDHIGIKPLFYSKKHNVFSSNVSSILKSKLIEKKIDKSALKEFMCFRQNFDGKTLFKSIKEFLPGHYMIIKKNQKIKYKKYWKPKKDKKNLNSQKVISLFKKSVQRRLLSDVPVGAFLSGGLDSSLLTSIMKDKQKKIISIDATVMKKNKEDHKFAKIASRHIGTKHLSCLSSKKEFISEMNNLIKYNLYPLNVPNEIMISKMSRDLKKRNIGVVLSGEGADELFGGYDRIMGSKEMKNKQRKRDFIKKYNYFKGIKCNLKMNFLSGTYKDNIYDFFLFNHISALLKRLDSATMFNSLEGRVPFLDIDLIEHLYQISPEKRYKKTILKEIAEKHLPYNLVYRKKVGFPMPLEYIFKTKEINGRLKKGRIKKYLPIKEIIESLKINENKGYKLWMLYNIEKFLEVNDL